MNLDVKLLTFTIENVLDAYYINVAKKHIKNIKKINNMKFFRRIIYA